MRPRLRSSVCVALGVVACQPDPYSSGGLPPPGSTGPAPTTTAGDEGTDATADDTGPDPGVVGPRKRRLDLDPALLAEDLGGTTLLVVLDPTRIEYADTLPGGADLRFKGPEEGAAYPVEIEQWDPEGRSLVWVRVEAPVLPDHLWMYYGDPEGFAPIDPAHVWSDDFAAVWHMGRTEAATLPDSSGHGHHLSPFDFSGEFGVEGQVGLATRITAVDVPTEGGPLDLDTAQQLALTDALTLEAWVSPEVAMDDATHSILRKGDALALRTLDPTSTHPTLVLRTVEIPGQHRVESGGSLPVDAWSHVAATYDASTGQLAIYRNGVLEGTETIEGEPAQRQVQSSDAVAQVGQHMQGRLDEVRVSTVARSAAWVRLQYAAMTDALLRFGPPVARD
ncbi:MAG: DUF2341 domain-containing protein [Myxococcales bacterium]|nr:DUF2341 domain-containing protein [Myxococcales bacterium]